MKDLDVSLKLCLSIYERKVLRESPLAIRTSFLVSAAFREGLVGFGRHYLAFP